MNAGPRARNSSIRLSETPWGARSSGDHVTEGGHVTPLVTFRVSNFVPRPEGKCYSEPLTKFSLMPILWNSKVNSIEFKIANYGIIGKIVPPICLGGEITHCRLREPILVCQWPFRRVEQSDDVCSLSTYHTLFGARNDGLVLVNWYSRGFLFPFLARGRYHASDGREVGFRPGFANLSH